MPVTAPIPSGKAPYSSGSTYGLWLPSQATPLGAGTKSCWPRFKKDIIHYFDLDQSPFFGGPRLSVFTLSYQPRSICFQWDYKGGTYPLRYSLRRYLRWSSPSQSVPLSFGEAGTNSPTGKKSCAPVSLCTHGRPGSWCAHSISGPEDRRLNRNVFPQYNRSN